MDYVTLDDEPVRAGARADPQGFVASLGRSTVIDEVQRVPELLLAVKSRLDRDQNPGQFLLTGSANLRRIPAVADALPGRVDYLTLWPLTQGETNGRREHLLDRVFAGDRPIVTDAPIGRHEYAQLLLRGGFPEPQARDRLERQASWSEQSLSSWHFREGEQEVDVIVERPSGEIACCEVNASATVRQRDFAGLVHMRDQLAGRFTAGFVVYAGERTVPFGDRLWALPLRGLWS
jgi:AAA domain